MGKYTSVLHKLTHLPDVEPTDRRQRLNIIKGNVGSLDLPQLCKKWVEMRKEKDELEESLKPIQENIDAFEEMICEKFQDQGTTSIRLLSGFSISYNPQPFTVVEDRDAFRVWCVENGFERSLQLPWQTANTVCKQRLIDGKEQPPGTKLWIKNGLTLRK